MTILLFISLHLRTSREIIEGVLRGARERRWNVQQFESVPPPDELRKIIDFWKPGGCLVYDEGRRNPTSERILRALPLVFLADRRPNRNAVNQDAGQTVRLALDELAQTGARTFAYIYPDLKTPWNHDRRSEFLTQTRQRGCAAKTLAFDPAGTDEQPIQNFLLRLPKPAGILIAADAYASRVIHAANHAGIRIPTDIAFIGVDNDELFCESLQPTLSSVILDFRTAGQRMIELLDDILKGGTSGHRSATYGPTGVCRRESTRASCRHPLVDKALRFIHLEAASPIGVNEVAAFLGLNRRSVERLFAAHADMSIASAIRAARIECAKTALAQSDSPVELIASTCGFRSAAHLKTIFLQETGLTMRAYRAACRS